MSTVPGIRLKARRALEVRLKAYADAATPAVLIEWPSRTFDRSAVERFFRFEIHYGRPRIRTMGQNPRIEAEGYAAIGCYVKQGIGVDALDDLTAILEPAFPYDLNLAFGGVSVNISAIETRDDAEIDSWRFAPVIVPWTVWRVA